MFVIIGAVIVLACVFGAYSVHGNLLILIQPVEFVIILGAALGAFIIGNTKTNIKQTLKGLKRALKGPTYKKADYIELLSVLYQLLKLAKTKGMLALEQHVDFAVLLLQQVNGIHPWLPSCSGLRGGRAR